MENISWIVEKEFLINGYSKGELVQGLQLFSSDKSIDYWLVSYGYFDIVNQAELYIEIQKLSEKEKFIEKNISMLIIVDATKDVKMLSNIVQVENDKVFFKKYVMPFYPSAAENLRSIMMDKKAQSISDILMDNEYFSNMLRQQGVLTTEYLLYTLAHKLPFIPIKVNHKERKMVELSFDDFNLSEDLEWVSNAPLSESDLKNYIESLLTSVDYEESDN